MPTLNIRVHDNRTFGRRPIVGVHSVRTVQKYRCETPRAIEDVDALPQKGKTQDVPGVHVRKLFMSCMLILLYNLKMFLHFIPGIAPRNS